MKLATIGYEAATLDGLIARLKAAEVQVVIDVRAIAASRRPGFSKGVLSASLTDAGLDYAHLKELGTPKSGRLAARSGRTAEMRRIFEAHLAEPAAQLQLAQAIDIARERKSALLCLEADATRCHRHIVAEHMRAQAGFEVENL